MFKVHKFIWTNYFCARHVVKKFLISFMIVWNWILSFVKKNELYHVPFLLDEWKIKKLKMNSTALESIPPLPILSAVLLLVFHSSPFRTKFSKPTNKPTNGSLIEMPENSKSKKSKLRQELNDLKAKPTKRHKRARKRQKLPPWSR